MGRRRWIGSFVALGVVALVAAALAHRIISGRVERALVAASAPRSLLPLEPIAVDDRPPSVVSLGRLWAASTRALDGASLRGQLVVATEGGLVEMSDQGLPGRLWTAWSEPGLADHDLTASIAQGDRLYLGSRSGAVTLVEGGRARSVRIDGGRLGAVVDLVWFDGALQVATSSGALIRVEADLTSSSLVEPVVEGGLTALAASADRLAAAGADGVVYQVVEGRLTPLAAPVAGQPRVRLTALAWAGDRLYAGSPTGLLGAREQGELELLRRDLFVTAILPLEERLVVGTFDQGALLLEAARLDGPPRRRWLPGRRVEGARLIGGRPYLFGPSLVARLDLALGEAQLFELPGGLASNHITALARDDLDQLWVGHFDDGVDVLDRRGELRRHLPAPGEEMPGRFSSVNALAWDQQAREMVVATSQGAVILRGDHTETLGQEDGLIGDALTALLLGDRRRVFATSQGLSVATLGSGASIRSIYAFHGLPSNRLYALASRGESLLVGTLGGVAEVDAGLEVHRIVRASPGGLQANWCVALAVAPEGVYVGTVGGGVDLVAPDGAVHPLRLDGVERFSVNPGAMLLQGDHLLVGTLDQGLLILNRFRREFMQFEQPLIGASVTALAIDGQALYLGTDRGLLRLEMEVIGV